MAALPHIGFISAIKKLNSACGKDIEVLEVKVDDDPAKLSAWAKHLRDHYVSPTLLPKLVEGTGKSNKEYLLDLKFPSCSDGFGPATRAGDFCEILVSDYFEYALDYVVPRTRYDNKTVRNESTKGEDVLAFKMFSEEVSADDQLVVCEVKGKLSGNKPDARLQVAVDACPVDESRLAESLNALKQRLIMAGKDAEAKLVQRFQNSSDHPYHRMLAAAAVICVKVYCAQTLSATSTTKHKQSAEIQKLFVFRGENLMTIVHAMYERAADEA